MDKMKRFAIYYAPRAGAFADAAAAWLGWDLLAGRAEASALPDLADHMADPRKYGFHGTIKPPFRLAEGVSPTDLTQAVARLATSLRAVELPALALRQIDGFLAFVPDGDTAALGDLAAEVVRALDPLRAPLTEAEVARRRPERLTDRQRALLGIYGYPYVMEEFQFHLTLTGRLSDTDSPHLIAAAVAHFGSTVPQPFRLEDLCLCGEDAAGQFHLLHRYALSA
ncbi:MAG: phosphonate metabolism protein [Rhodobacterales bacterium RIFCSPHIGHO2_02_FULL_62_130]|nr:MAG: phosphonate metabolism protein [Rhodobacterales bacterium RIFCSPHIGHO2_02_FULL_62_130]OHC56779.1 MAG: phosphonate metabolism protein [Rhodobacterales bacterium RIFCSPHIGHO2_12_FULL_62_75]HCZ00710.1 phosphonate metabolism protein [Rhodobacter sp.]